MLAIFIAAFHGRRRTLPAGGGARQAGPRRSRPSSPHRPAPPLPRRPTIPRPSTAPPWPTPISPRSPSNCATARPAASIAEQGMKFAEKAVALKPENAEYYRLLGTLYGQAVTDLMSGLSYGPKAKDAINKAVEKAPKSSMMYVARGVGNYYVPAQLGGGAKLAIPDFRKAIELDPRECRSVPVAGAQPAQGESRRRSAPGFRQIAGTQSQPRLGQTAIGKDAGEMKPLATAAVCVALALADFLSVPRPHLAAAGHPDLRSHPGAPARPRRSAQRYSGAASARRLHALRRNGAGAARRHRRRASAKCSPPSRSSPARSASGACC